MRKTTVALFAGLIFAGAPALGEGLDELSQGNPEKAQEAEPAEGEGEGEPAAAKTPAMVQSATSKSLADKLFFQTSFGWVKASKGKGEWSGGGMSDFAAGYKLAALNSAMSIAGTYRYAPVAVSGVEDDVSYRGIWETHFFGARLNYVTSPSLTVVGTGELGYTMVHTAPVDGQEQDKKAEAGGGQVALGGGADFQIVEKVHAGPRLVLGFGSFTTIQVAGAVGFLF